MRVVGSITTVPFREDKLLRTLQSLHNQDYPLDAIYLGVPKISRRLKQPYPSFSDEIKQLCTIVPCDDYGPCTKIVGGLLNEEDPSTIIITFDDDVVYSPNVVSSMVYYHMKYPNVAIGSSGILLGYGFPFYSSISNCSGNWNNITGFELSQDGRSVDALCGFSAILYIRKFFPSKDKLYDEFLKYPLMDDDVYFNDDIMISAYLSKQNVERMVFPGIPVINENKVHNPRIDKLDGNEISFDKIGFLQRFRRSINKVKEWGFFSESQNVTIYETIGGRIIILSILLLIIIGCCVFLFSCLN